MADPRSSGWEEEEAQEEKKGDNESGLEGTIGKGDTGTDSYSFCNLIWIQEKNMIQILRTLWM